MATETRFVTFADILGFKDLVEQNPHDEVLTIYRGVLREAVEYGVGGGIDHDPALAVVNMRLISDSVVMWTDSDAAVDFEVMVLAVTNLLAAGMHYGLPFRAATAWGHVDAWTSEFPNPRLKVETIVGQAFVDAYQHESRQHWSGGMVLDAAVNRYEVAAESSKAASGVEGLVSKNYLVRYDVPIKAPHDYVGPPLSEAAYAYNWTRPFGDALLHDGDIRNPFEDFNKRVDDKVKVAIDNTVAFARHINRVA